MIKWLEVFCNSTQKFALWILLRYWRKTIVVKEMGGFFTTSFGARACKKGGFGGLEGFFWDFIDLHKNARSKTWKWNSFREPKKRVDRKCSGKNGLKLPIVLRVPLAVVIVDDVEQLPGVGGDSILPSLLGVKDFYMLVLKMWMV